MNKNEKMSFLKGKGAAIGIVVCFMAVLAVVGTYTVGNYKKDMKEQMAKAEKEAEQFTEDNTKETTTDEILLPEVEETDENEQESREDVSDTTGTEEGVQQTGLTVTLDMGNGYSAVYGQLKDVQVKTGDYVAAGSAIGSLNEPTKYYSVEGTNLYFQVLKDGEPVDPMNFME